MSQQEQFEVNDDGDKSGRRIDWDVASELKPLEAKLASLSPRADRLKRDQLMFLAGRALFSETSAGGAAAPGSIWESRAWPAAFAAMSSVAATLLVVLLTRPEILVRQLPPTSRPQAQTDSRLATVRSFGDSVLSTLDAHWGNIDKLLAREEPRSDVRDSTTKPIEYRSAPLLTPARWDRAINDSDALDILPTGAFDLSRIQGART